MPVYYCAWHLNPVCPSPHPLRTDMKLPGKQHVPSAGNEALFNPRLVIWTFQACAALLYSQPEQPAAEDSTHQ